VVERRLGPAASAALSACGDDPACLAERAAPLGVDTVLGGWLARSGDAYRVALVHVEVRGGGTIARVEREVPIASRRLVADVTSAAPALLRGGADVAGTLAVETEDPGAEVVVDGAPAGTTPLRKRLRPGRHEVRVHRPGHAPLAPAFVDVPPGGEVVHRPRLVPVPVRDGPAGAGGTRVEVTR
jgi:hypothetical protein